jgi:hypothetical protein
VSDEAKEGTVEFYRGHAALYLLALGEAGAQDDCAQPLAEMLAAAFDRGESRLRARLAEVEGALTKIAAADREYADEEDGPCCAECGCAVATGDGLDPAPECWPCSTQLLRAARESARAVLFPTHDGGGTPPKESK